MLKLLGSNDPVRALELMIDTEVIDHVLEMRPDIAILSRLLTLAPNADPLLRLVALLRSGGSHPDKPASTTVAERWRLANAETARLERLTLAPKLNVSATVKRARQDLYRLGAKDYLDLFYLSAAETGAKAENVENAVGLASGWTSPRLPVRGQDLIDQGVPPGPGLGELLAQLEQWWLEQDMQPDRSACLLELKRRLGQNPR